MISQVRTCSTKFIANTLFSWKTLKLGYLIIWIRGWRKFKISRGAWTPRPPLANVPVLYDSCQDVIYNELYSSTQKQNFKVNQYWNAYRIFFLEERVQNKKIKGMFYKTRGMFTPKTTSDKDILYRVLFTDSSSKCLRNVGRNKNIPRS